MSSDLVWQIIGRQNSFTVKDRAGGAMFSTEPGNLLGKHSYKYSGIANAKTIDIQPAVNEDGSGGGVTFATTKKGTFNKPAGKYNAVTLKRGPRKAIKAAKALSAGSFYRSDLEKVAVIRTSQIIASQKKRKARKVRGRKANALVSE